MTAVLDTNILLVANGQFSPEDIACEKATIQLIKSLNGSGEVGLDRSDLILREYGRKLDRRKPHGVGMQLVINLYTGIGVRLVDITPHYTRGFEEFPNDAQLEMFDPDDRKFVATALACGSHLLHVATDSDFWIHRHALEANQVQLSFTCEHRFADPS